MDAETILALWEAAEGPGGGRGRTVGRAARLLAAAGEADPGALSLGTAAARLLALRARLVGDALEGVADCPACAARHEVRLDATAFAAPTFDAPTLDPPTLDPPTLDGGPADVPIVVEHGGWRALLRVPSLDDWEAAARCVDAQAGAALLREAAILTSDGPGEPPEGLIEAIEAALDAAEPLADARLTMVCDACGVAWEVGLDPAAFLVSEIATLARRQMAEIAALARAYGWSETAILAISPARRRVYRELAG